MATTPYRNFDLYIQRNSDGSGYVARAQSPSGEGTARFALPFSNLELEHFVLSIAPGRGRTRRIDTHEVALAKRFGEQLFGTVFAGEVGGLLRSSLSEAGTAGSKLRLRLRLNDAPELADVPWEYMYNSALNRFLSLDDDTAIVRYLELPERVRPVAVSLPLHILVIISSPTDFPRLDVEQEWRNLQEAMSGLLSRGLVSLDLLDGANLPALRRRLQAQQYNILHFIGHGGFDRNNQEGVLMMTDEAGRGRQVSGQQLGWLLHNHKSLALAVLNACEGARADQADAFAGTAQSLVQQGIPAVVAMQFEITDDAAKTFASAFYSALAAGDPVESALTETRLAIFAEGQMLEWGTPVLFMRSPDGRLFDVHAPVRGASYESAPLPAPTLPAATTTPLSTPPLEASPDTQPVPESPSPVASTAPAEMHPETLPSASVVPADSRASEPGSAENSVSAPKPERVKEISVPPAASIHDPVVDPGHAQVSMLFNAALAAASQQRWADVINNVQTVLMFAPNHQEAQSLLRHALLQREPVRENRPVIAATAGDSPEQARAVTATTKSLLVASLLEAIGLISPLQGLGHFYLGNLRLGALFLAVRLLLSFAVAALWTQIISSDLPYYIFTVLPFFQVDFYLDYIHDYLPLALLIAMSALIMPAVSQLLILRRFRPAIQQIKSSPTASASQRTKLQLAALLEAIGIFFPLQGMGHFYAGRKIVGVIIFVANLAARIFFMDQFYQNSPYPVRELLYFLFPVRGLDSVPNNFANYSDQPDANNLSLIIALVSLLVPVISLVWFAWQSRRHARA